MKKRILSMLLLSLVFCGCSNKKVEELNQQVISLHENIEELNSDIDIKNKQIKENEKTISDLKEKLNHYTYTPGKPTKTGTPIDNVVDLEEILVAMDSKIVGNVSNAVGYGNSMTFDIETEKGGVYTAFLSMNDNQNDILSLTIYINSEFCYSWLNESLYPMGTGEWKLDGLSN